MPRELTLTRLGLRLTPSGHLVTEPTDDAPAVDAATAARLTDAFARGTGHGLLRLGAAEVGHLLPPASPGACFAARYVAALCLHAPTVEPVPRSPDPAAGRGERASLGLTAPMMPGAQYPDVRHAARIMGTKKKPPARMLSPRPAPICNPS